MKCIKLLALGCLAFNIGCAAIVKSSRQQVFFRGAPEQGVTKVQTPDGLFDLENGQGSFLLTRSKSDIPMKVMCPDGTSKSGVIQTSFDWLAGGLGNWWTYFLGSGVDAAVDKGYDIDNVTLMGYCKSNEAVVQKTEPSREISSSK